MDVGAALSVVDVFAREAALFAAVGLLLGGIDDIAVDLVYLIGCRTRTPVPPVPAGGVRRFAILVPAWDESSVIGAMLDATLTRLGRGDYRIYVGAYPNDRATIAEVVGIAERDRRVRLAIGGNAGPTTKGDNLNSMWRALCRDAATDGWRPAAVVLHDAEDLVDPDELVVFDAMLHRYDVVQLPVLPIIAPTSRWVSAHYADEFVEAAARSLAVRQSLGAGLPLAGTGCAIGFDLLTRVAEGRGGAPFDAASLTEDYELGLTLAAQGGRGCFATMQAADGRRIAVRSIFPTRLTAAVRQKARWVTGIALLGWDRLGWGGANALAEYWMRMRDRRAPLAMLVLGAAYVALATTALSTALHLALGVPMPAVPAWLVSLFLVNSLILLWRLAMRAGATGLVYGWREGLRAMPRMLVANLIALAAARRALADYIRILFGAPPRWDKTSHVFPADPEVIAR